MRHITFVRSILLLCVFLFISTSAFSQTPDFNVQHIGANVPRTGGNLNITAVSSLNNAFALPNNNRKTQIGPGAGNLDGDDLSGAVRLTGINQLTYSRDGGSEDVSAIFRTSVWEYIGPAGGENEMIVRGRYTLNLNGGTNSVTQALAGIINPEKCIPFITGILNSGTGDDADSGTAVAYLEDATTLRVQKGSTDNNVSVFITLVEFTGSNWTVLHGDSGATAADTGSITLRDNADGTGTATSVSDWSNAFIFSHHRGDVNTSGTNDAIADNWPVMRNGGTNQTVDWEFHVNHESSGTNRQFVHVLENPNLNITRFQDTNNDAGATTIDIASAGITSINEALIVGSSSSSGTGTAYSRGWRNYFFSSTTLASHEAARSGNTMSHEIQIIDLTGLESLNYCPSTADPSDTFNDGITEVIFNTINNTSGTANYTDFTSVSTTIEQGSTHDLSVRINNPGNNNFLQRVWIDWNQDFDFDDAGEAYDLGSVTTVGNNQLTSNSPLTITVPLTAQIGSTRMRVTNAFNATPLSCGTFNFGEVEDYTINIIAPTIEPEIDISGLSISIADGDTTPEVTDDTDFNTILVGNSNSNIFTITNTGNLPLNLTDASPFVTITGSTNFTITAIPNNTIAIGDSTTFEITYTPTVSGTDTATVSVANDDSDENPYNFAITGSGAGPQPEVGLSGLGNNILDGDTTPITTDGTDFGNLLIGSTTFTDFIISNTGAMPLNLTGAAPYVTITGPDAGEFTLTTAPTTPIPTSGGSSTFRITYNPNTGGTHNATVSFANDDSNENPYNFDITGFASNTLIPEIEITGLGVVINDGDTTPDMADNTNFGVTDIGNTNVNDFTINNIGTGLLTLTGGSPYVTITGADAAQFSIASIPANTLIADATTIYQISYTPTTVGVHNASISVASDDANENPYNYNIQGTGVINNEPSHTIYYENFDVNDGGWTATNPGGNSVWAYGTNGVEPGTEGNYWYTDNYDNYASNSDTFATSPLINLSGFNNVQLKLDIRYDTNGDAGSDDGMNVEYSDDGGATWQILGAFAATPIDNWYNESDVDALGTGSDGWAGLNTGGAGGGRSDFVQAIINVPPSLHDNAQARLRVHFASDNGNNDKGVNFDNILILGDPIIPFGDPIAGPADINTNLTLWLKTDVGTNGVADGNAITTWSDQAFDNDGELANNPAPIYFNNALENINHNPVLNFDSVNDTQLKGKGGYYTDEYWIVMQSDGSINSIEPLEGVVSGRVNTTQFAEDGTGFWINPGSIRFENVNNVVSHMIGSTPSAVGANSEPSYGRAYVSDTDSYDNEVIIFNVKFDAANNRSTIFKNGIQIDNHTGRAFDQGTGIAGGDLQYGESNNTNYALGVGRITIAGTPFDSHYNGKMTEFISYSAPNSEFDQKRIQSYLAIKNGVTLHSINSTTATRLGDEDYIDSDGDVIWNTITHTGFNYDIAGIGRDDDASLNQKQSTSSNPGAVVTMGLTNIFNTNSDNVVSNPDTFNDQDFLMWGNDNEPFAADTPIMVDMSAGIPGLSSEVDFTAIQRVWKVVERGSVGEVEVSVPESVLSATLDPPGDYLMFVSDTPSFSPTSEYRVMRANGINLQAQYDFDGVKYITFGFAPEYFYERSITFDGVRDFLEIGDELDRTSAFTISAWIKRTNQDYSIISKRNAAYTEGYDISLLNNRHIEMSWINGSGTQDIESTTEIPEGEWHQFAFTYDGTSEAKVYIDGVLDNTQTLSPPIANDQDFLIGAADGTATADFYEGTLDEVRVWDIELTEDQVRFIMNQEIEENADLTVAGRIVPTTISRNEFSATAWASLAGYFPMNRYTFTNVIDESNNDLVAAIRNLETVDFQTAPLPYVSTDNGDWTNINTWENGTTQPLPASQSIVDNTLTVDWNIVQTAHDITTNENNTVLSLEVASDELSVENNSKIEVSHYLRLDGVIDLVEESQLVQTANSDFDTASAGNLERDQQGTADTYSYNIWSAPVSTINVAANNEDYAVSNVMLDGSDIDNPVSILFSGGLDGAPSSPIIISAAWLFKFTNDPAGDFASWQYIGPAGSVTPGQGYTMKGPGTGAVEDPQNYTFRGKPNNSTDADEITFEIFAGNQYLIGNPFPSALDANDFIQDNAHLNGTLYFWQHWGGGNHILADYEGGYATYTLAGGVPAVSHPSVDQTGTGTITPGRYIPVGQGFFTAAETAGTITINNSQRNFVRESSGSSFFFFTGNQIDNSTSSANSQETVDQGIDDSFFDAPDLREKIRFVFDSPEEYHRELLLTIDPATTLGYDRMYDGLNSGGPEDDLQWMIEGAQGVIQAIPEIEGTIELPLVLTTSSTGTSAISISHIAYENANVDVYLRDSLLETYTDLKQGAFSIDLEAGVYTDRFFIVFEALEEDTTSDDDDDSGDTSNDDDTSDTGDDTTTDDDNDTSDTGDDTTTDDDNDTSDTGDDTTTDDDNDTSDTGDDTTTDDDNDTSDTGDDTTTDDDNDTSDTSDDTTTDDDNDTSDTGDDTTTDDDNDTSDTGDDTTTDDDNDTSDTGDDTTTDDDNDTSDTGDDTTTDDDNDTSDTGDDTTTDDDNDSNNSQDSLSVLESTDEIENQNNILTVLYNGNSKAITISNSQNTTISNVFLHNVLGQLMKQWSPNIDTQELELPVQSMSTGIYLLSIQTENGIESKKIIIH